MHGEASLVSEGVVSRCAAIAGMSAPDSQLSGVSEQALARRLKKRLSGASIIRRF
jgi:hypothetical protein